MDNFSNSLLEATDLEIGQRDKYAKAFENEYKLTNPLREYVPATNKDIGSKATVAHISTVAINMTTAGATGTVFYFLELEVLAKEFGVVITNPIVMFVSGIFALAAVMGIDFTLTSIGLAQGENDDHPHADHISHWAAGITAATAGVFRGLLYFKIIPPGSFTETIVKSLVLLAIAVLPVLVLYPAARISGYYLGWVYKENKRRSAEHDRLKEVWMDKFQEAFKGHLASRVTTANALQKKMIQATAQAAVQQTPQPAPQKPSNFLSTGEITHFIEQAIKALCAENSGFDPLNIYPVNVQERLESGGIPWIKENTLRPIMMRIKANMLNQVLYELDSSPFQSKDEFCVKLSQKYGRTVLPAEISNALLMEMQHRYASVQ